jgi:hypothetical protein
VAGAFALRALSRDMAILVSRDDFGQCMRPTGPGSRQRDAEIFDPNIPSPHHLKRGKT